MKKDTALRIIHFMVGISLASALLHAAPTEEVAVVETPHGEIVFRFFDQEAPGHTAYVKELIRRGFYDGTTFHRVIPHFVIQGGDPNSKDADRSNDGEGEADRKLEAEFSRTLYYRPGTIGMARDQDPDSGSCQFFIALESLPRLDGRYSIFGEAVTGLDVARTIAGVPRDLRDNPLERVKITVHLEQREVPNRVVSKKKGESGETITGPVKPIPWDPGDRKWTPPVLISSVRASKQEAGERATEPLDITIAENGSVLDIRFERLDVENAPQMLSRVRTWKFEPARFDGQPTRTRFAVDSGGAIRGPSRVPGTPMEITGNIEAPTPAISVNLPPGAKLPSRETSLRVTIDESGRVVRVSIQAGSGNEALDKAAITAAEKMFFVPARLGEEPVSVYLDLPVRFVEGPRE